VTQTCPGALVSVDAAHCFSFVFLLIEQSFLETHSKDATRTRGFPKVWQIELSSLIFFKKTFTHKKKHVLNSALGIGVLQELCFFWLRVTSVVLHL
jgi:hypothetical protein